MDFQFSREEDEMSALLLSRLLEEKGAISSQALKNAIHGKQVTVAASAFEPHQAYDVGDGVLIATGSSMELFLAMDKVPDIIVTDLDGDIEIQLELDRRGSIVVIHAHGDNAAAIEEWVPQFTGRVIGTTQSKPLQNVHNFGGFTDGDRAALMADHFHANEIKLLGFDFENPVPKPGSDPEVKKRKLAWARKLIHSIIETK